MILRQITRTINTNKRQLAYALTLAGIAAACLWAFLIWRGNGPQLTVEISQNGIVIRRLVLEELRETVYIPVGDGNVVAADAGGVFMERADCRDQLCVKQGRIHRAGQQIVCLPNRVMVTLKKGSAAVDGVSG